MPDDLTMFDTFNAYNNIESITARSPEELTAALRSIRTAIKIVSIVEHNKRLVAFIIGDIRKKRGRPPKGDAGGNE